MADILTLPFDFAVEMLQGVLNTPHGGWQGVDEKSRWTIGHDVDEKSGQEFLQIIREDLIVIAKD